MSVSGSIEDLSEYGSETGSEVELDDSSLEEHMQKILAEAEAHLSAHVSKKKKARRAMKKALRSDAQNKRIVQVSTPPPAECLAVSKTPFDFEEMSPGTKFEKEVLQLGKKQEIVKKSKLIQELLDLNGGRNFEKLRSFILRVIAKKSFMRRLLGRSRVVSVKLIDVKDHIEEIGAFSFGALPDIFISLSTFNSFNQCFWRQQSTVLPMSNPVWNNERHLVCVPGPGASLVFNVMSRAALLGDTFLGQVVVEIDQLIPYNTQRGGDNFVVSYLSGSARIPLCDTNGQVCATQPVQQKATGVLSIALSPLSCYDHMCGYFRDVKINIFGVVELTKIWVITGRTENNSIMCSIYDSKYAGETRLIRTFCCEEVKNFENIGRVNSYTASLSASGTDDGYIQFFLNSTGEKLLWAWDTETVTAKGMWCRLLNSSYSSTGSTSSST